MSPPAGPSDPFLALDGFDADDLAAGFACFKRSARALVDGTVPLRPALPVTAALIAACRAALDQPDGPSHDEARRFFERHFEPSLVRTEAGADAFFTGYYEPVVEGALEAEPGFTAPLLARPSDLRTFAAEDLRPAALAGFSAARVTAGGTVEPYDDRAAIEAAALGGAYRPLVWLRDWVEAFLIHVQGSARVRLADGRMLRLTYAGRNGHPYTSIGRILVECGDIAPGAMSLDRLKSWLREHGQGVGEHGRALMQRNASFIFFACSEITDDTGPTGGAGVPLTALRSIAVDRSLWCYGLPFWIEAELPWQGAGGTASFRRLMIAQDTGSAIVGAARADLYFGSGAEAGRRAGDIRHHGRFTVLHPREPGAAA